MPAALGDPGKSCRILTALRLFFPFLEHCTEIERTARLFFDERQRAADVGGGDRVGHAAPVRQREPVERVEVGRDDGRQLRVPTRRGRHDEHDVPVELVQQQNETVACIISRAPVSLFQVTC